MQRVKPSLIKSAFSPVTGALESRGIAQSYFEKKWLDKKVVSQPTED